jgi:molecular chaperone GrpE
MQDEERNLENEIVSEDLDDSVVAEEHQSDQVKKLKSKLKIAEEKAKEYLDGWQRAQADFVNLRRRDEEAKTEFIKFANEKLVEELIPVLDSFNIALSLGHKELEPLYNQFIQVLKANNLEVLDPKGETFDPRFHESIGVEIVKNKEEDNKIIEVLQKGYGLAGRVVRPAKVRVGQYGEN